jgi:uncharacterized RmlC-like cupin family protein
MLGELIMMDEPTADLPIEPEQPGVCIVHPGATTQTRQQLPYFVGISANTTGATGISMNLAVIPPGGTAEPHLHANYETAIYLLKGRVETRYGRGLKQTKIAETGDFIFVRPGVPHQPHNLSADEPAYALVARNDPNEQENIVLYDPTLESKP